MAATIIHGGEVASTVRNRLVPRIAALKERGVTPKLAVVLVEGNGASRVYVNNQKKAFQEMNLTMELYDLDPETPQEELLKLIEIINEDPDTHGIIVQLPLPHHIDEFQVISAISPEKDMDGFHHRSLGSIILGDSLYLPCTPAGMMELIRSTNVPLEGKHCVVVGRSNIVGKPIALLMLHENCTVSICHSYTKNLEDFTKEADILIAAVGKPEFLTGEMIKPGAVVIDVGMNRNKDGKLVGDVDFDSAKEVAGYLTPVPGGVGPMTITMLISNTVAAAEKSSLS